MTFLQRRGWAMTPCARWPDGWLFEMSGPTHEGISWQNLPRERQLRLLVLIGTLVRQQLAVLSTREASDEHSPAGDGSVAHGQDPGLAP